MVHKGNLAVIESSSISKTREARPTKIGVHACDINAYLHACMSACMPLDFVQLSSSSSSSSSSGTFLVKTPPRVLMLLR